MDDESSPKPGQMHEVLDGILRTNDPDIFVPLDEVFEA